MQHHYSYDIRINLILSIVGADPMTLAAATAAYRFGPCATTTMLRGPQSSGRDPHHDADDDEGDTVILDYMYTDDGFQYSSSVLLGLTLV